MMLSSSRVVPTCFAVLVVVLLLLLSLDPALASPEPEPEHLVDPQVVLQGERPPPQVTPYYVKATTGSAVASGSLSPKGMQINDSLAEITVPGPQAPRFLLSRVGRFTMQITTGMDLEVLAVSQVSVWAKSNEDVQNAQFRVLFMQNGNTRSDMRTNRANLNNMPLEFTVLDPPTYATPLTFRQGDLMSMEIQYTASSRRVIGPAPGAVLLASNLAHPTRIELLCRPLEMNVSSPTFADKHLHVTGKVIDTSELDAQSELIINLDIVTAMGTLAESSSIERMNFLYKEPTGENVINWTWDYKRFNPTDGLYEFRIDVSYGVIGRNYTNSSYYEVVFPKEKKQGGVITPQMTYLIMGIVAAALVAAFFVVRQRSSRAYPRYYPRRGPPPKPKKPKLSRAERKALKMGTPPPVGTPMPTRGPPPPRGPPPTRGPPKPSRGAPPSARGPPKDRTPMPGKAPQAARGPPFRPDGVPEPRRVGTARTRR